MHPGASHEIAGAVTQTTLNLGGMDGVMVYDRISRPFVIDRQWDARTLRNPASASPARGCCGDDSRTVRRGSDATRVVRIGPGGASFSQTRACETHLDAGRLPPTGLSPAADTARSG